MRTKQGHAEFVDWLPFLGCIIVVFAGPLADLFLPEKANYLEAKQWITGHAWYFSAVGLLTIISVAFWHSFTQWDALNESLKHDLDITILPPEEGEPQPYLKNLVFLLGLRNCSSRDLEECLVELIEVQNGDKKWTCNNALCFQPHEESLSATPKTLHPLKQYKVDVLFLEFGRGVAIYPGTKVAGIHPHWQRVPKFADMFSYGGEHFLRVAITAKGTFPTIFRTLKFTESGRNSKLELVSPS